MFPESNHKLDLVRVNTEEAFLLIDREYIIITFNDKFRQLYHNYFNSDIVEGRSIFDFVRSQRILTLSKIYENALAGFEFKEELDIPLPDKSIHNFAVTYKPAYDTLRQIRGIFITLHDITATVKAKTELQISEERYRSIVEHSISGIMLMQVDGTILEANKSAIDMFGFTLEELKKIKKESLFDVTDPRYIAAMHQWGADGRIQTEFTGIRKGGEKFPCEFSSVLYIDITGEYRASTTIIDVTERKKMEDDLRLSASLLNAVGQAVMATQLNGAVIYWNSVAEQLYGWTAQEAIGKNIMNLTPTQQSKENAQEIMQQIQKGHSWSGEFLVRKKDGSSFPVFVTDSPIYNNKGELTGIIGVSTDITGRKLAEEKIRNSEELYRSIFDNSPVPIWISDRTTLEILEANDKALQHYGYSRDEFLSMTALDIRTEDGHSDLQKVIEQSSQKDFKNSIIRHRKKNGELIYVQPAVVKINYKGKEAFLVMISDITETLRHQKKLGEEKIIRQKEVTRATIDGQEKERAHIGRELNDNVNQMLASAKLYLQCSLSQPEQREDLIERSQVTINACIDEIRQLSRSLVPPSLGEISLTEAIHDHLTSIEVFKDKSVYADLHNVNEFSLSEGLKITLFRIVQEQLSNIVKYASATQVRIKLDQGNDMLELLIEDNGIGFDVNTVRKGTGITNIFNRAETYNGSVILDSAPGKGCMLHVSFSFGQAHPKLSST